MTVVASTTVAEPARADGPRPPTSSNLGITPPNWASDPIPTNIVIAPRPGENFQPFTIISVQVVPMMKILRDGTVDPDQALAYWDFTLRFPRSSMFWPPFLPEPTDPWKFHYFEMPDGGITGVGPQPGSPLYTPPTGLPADWLQRLAQTARAEIPQATFHAALVHAMVNKVTGGLLQSPALEAAILAALAAPDPQGVANLADTVTQYLTAEALGALIGLDVTMLGLLAAVWNDPCYSRTLAVFGAVIVTAAAMVKAVFATNPIERVAFAGTALGAYITGVVLAVSQVTACQTLINSLVAAELGPLAAAVQASADLFIMASFGALIVVFILVGSATLAVIASWAGA